MSARRTMSALATALLSLGALAAFGSGAAADDDTEADAASNDTPAATASEGQWHTWAERRYLEAQSIDWAADSAARGCELLEVSITTGVDAVYNESVGAPAGLATVVVERLEHCTQAQHSLSSRDANGSPETSIKSLPPGPRCNETRGPGTICISSTGGFITGSWLNSSSGNVTGFLRIYTMPNNATSCSTHTTWFTGPTMTWRPGETRSISRSKTHSGNYSTYIWREALIGHTNLGGTCAWF